MLERDAEQLDLGEVLDEDDPMPDLLGHSITYRIAVGPHGQAHGLASLNRSNPISSCAPFGAARCRSCRNDPMADNQVSFTVRLATAGESRAKFGPLRPATRVKRRHGTARDTAGNQAMAAYTSYTQRDGHLLYLNIDRRWESMRDHPEFVDIHHRIGLP